MPKRGVFLGKKGQEMETEVYSTLMQIAILVFVLLSLGFYLKSVRDNTLFEKMYLARDVALVMNTLYAAPENTGMIYAAGEVNLANYSFDAKDNYITVSKKDESSGNEKYYHYATDRAYEEKFSAIVNSKTITFIKDDNHAAVNSSNEFILNDLICAQFDSSASNWKPNAIIDPGHGDDPNRAFEGRDTGFIMNTLQESDYTMQIGTILRNMGYRLTREYEHFIPQATRITAALNAEVIISLHLDNYSSDRNIIKAYISAESTKALESRKLACLLLSSLAELKPDGAAIIPVFVSELTADDPRRILLKDKIAVLLELGNINSKKNFKMYDIASSINNGLVHYYE
jgi:N-acetylmuramoyl-L-alanine amidase